MRVMVLMAAVMAAALYSQAAAQTRPEEPAGAADVEVIDSVSTMIKESGNLPVKQAALAALNGDGRRNAMLVLGLLALQDETLDEALRWFGKLRTIDAADPEAPFLIALTQTWAGSSDDALRTLQGIERPEGLPRRDIYLEHVSRTRRDAGEKAQQGSLRCVLEFFAWYENRPASDGAGPLSKDCAARAPAPVKPVR